MRFNTNLNLTAGRPENAPAQSFRPGSLSTLAQAAPTQSLPPLESLAELVNDIARSERGVTMTMGKGGVGKTTIAAAIATELARRGHEVHLSTTDPAPHVAAAAGHLDGLHLSRMDPRAGTRAYVEHVLATAARSN